MNKRDRTNWTKTKIRLTFKMMNLWARKTYEDMVAQET